MVDTSTTTFRVGVAEDVTVTAKLDAPESPAGARRFFVLAHGANNDLDFPLLVYLARQLAETGTAAVVRFNFPYVERGVTSPDPRPVLAQTLSRVYEHVASRLAPDGSPIFIGGKSLGGRAACEMVSRRLEGTGLDAAGLVVLGYPLHKAGEKDRLFLDPLRHIGIPSLFCIGSHDPMCDPELLRPVLAGLESPGELYVVEGGDHSLHLPHSHAGGPRDSYGSVARKVGEFIRQVSP